MAVVLHSNELQKSIICKSHHNINLTLCGMEKRRNDWLVLCQFASAAQLRRTPEKNAIKRSGELDNFVAHRPRFAVCSITLPRSSRGRTINVASAKGLPLHRSCQTISVYASVVGATFTKGYKFRDNFAPSARWSLFRNPEYTVRSVNVVHFYVILMNVNHPSAPSRSR